MRNKMPEADHRQGSKTYEILSYNAARNHFHEYEIENLPKFQYVFTSCSLFLLHKVSYPYIFKINTLHYYTPGILEIWSLTLISVEISICCGFTWIENIAFRWQIQSNLRSINSSLVLSIIKIALWRIIASYENRKIN